MVGSIRTPLLRTSRQQSDEIGQTSPIRSKNGEKSPPRRCETSVDIYGNSAPPNFETMVPLDIPPDFNMSNQGVATPSLRHRIASMGAMFGFTAPPSPGSKKKRAAGSLSGTPEGGASQETMLQNEGELHSPPDGNIGSSNYSRLKSSPRVPAWMPQMQRQRKFTVVEIYKGKSKSFDMQTPELLRKVHYHNKQRTLEDTAVGSLKLRDLRQVCSIGSLGGYRPSIEPRRNCILVNIPPVRCLILHDRVLMIPPTYGNVESQFNLTEGSSLTDKFVHLSDMKTAGPFEFVALEALLVEICSILNNEFAPLNKKAAEIVDQIHKEPSGTSKLLESTDLRRKMDSVADKVRGVQTALREILDKEDDLQRLEISKFWENPNEWDNPSADPSTEDLEILLECYEQEVESILRQCTRTDESLDDALRLMELHLAGMRNVFLKAELGLDIVGVVVAFVAAIAGIFGMNIHYDGSSCVSPFKALTYLMWIIQP